MSKTWISSSMEELTFADSSGTSSETKAAFECNKSDFQDGSTQTCPDTPIHSSQLNSDSRSRSLQEIDIVLPGIPDLAQNKFNNTLLSSAPCPSKLMESPASPTSIRPGIDYFSLLPADPNGPLSQIFGYFDDIKDKLTLERVSSYFLRHAQNFCWDDVTELRISVECHEDAYDPKAGDDEHDEETDAKNCSSSSHSSSRFRTLNPGYRINGQHCDSFMKLRRGINALLKRCDIENLSNVMLDGEGYADDVDRAGKARIVFDLLKNSDCEWKSIHTKKLFTRSSDLYDFLVHSHNSCEKFRAEWMFFDTLTERDRFYEGIQACRNLKSLNLDWDLGASIEECTPNLMRNALEGKRLESLSLYLFSNIQTRDFCKALSSLDSSLKQLKLNQCRSLDLPTLLSSPDCSRAFQDLEELELITIVGDEVFAYEIYKFFPALPSMCPKLRKLKIDLGFLDFDEFGHYEKEMIGLTLFTKNFLEMHKDDKELTEIVLTWHCDGCRADPKIWIDMVKSEVYFDHFGLILDDEDWVNYDESMVEGKIAIRVSRKNANVIFITSWDTSLRMVQCVCEHELAKVKAVLDGMKKLHERLVKRERAIDLLCKGM